MFWSLSEAKLTLIHNSKMQLSAVRTMVWMKDGLKSRKNALKNKLPGHEAPREPHIQSEV